MPGPTFLDADAIELRVPTKADREWINKQQNDSRIWRSMLTHTPTQLEDTPYEQDDETVRLLICDSNVPVGKIWLRQAGIQQRYGTGTLGYWIAPDEWGQGYATAAVERMVTYGFKQRRLHRITADVFECNPASAAVVETNGFHQEGTEREAAFIDGEYHDVRNYGLLRSEWMC